MATPTRHILDLCCCAGGASRGYADAGFTATGVDIDPQPSYPYPILQADAVEVLRSTWYVRQFDAVHISPPCQGYCATTKGTNARRNADQGRSHVMLYEPLRELALRLDIPVVIENPAAWPHLVLCGEMFGLGVIRHRRFELVNWAAQQPQHVPHRGRVRGYRHGAWHDGPYVAAYGQGGGKATVTEMRTAMGIDWTDDHRELREAIPPAYTRWIGQQLMAHLDAVEAVAA